MIGIAVYVLGGLILGHAPSGPAQENQALYKLLTQERKYECYDLLVNAEGLIPDYFIEGKTDSVMIIIDYVDKVCETNAFGPLRILSSIESGDFSESAWCDSGLAGFILWSRGIGGNFPYVREMVRSDVPDESRERYLSFLIDLALKLAGETDSGSFERAVCEYYAWADNDLYERLSGRQYAGTCLQDEYDRYMEHVGKGLVGGRGYRALGAGAWLPTGANKALGRSVEVGGLLGGKFDRWGLDLSLGMQFPEKKEPFNIKVGDQVRPRDDFPLGFYIGLNASYEVLRRGTFATDLVTGIGAEGFNVLKESDTTNGRTITSYAIFLGITQRLYYDRYHSRFVGLQARYNVMDLKNSGGDDLSGNAVSLNLIWGLLGSKPVIEEARRFHYYDWEKTGGNHTIRRPPVGGRP